MQDPIDSEEEVSHRTGDSRGGNVACALSQATWSLLPLGRTSPLANPNRRCGLFAKTTASSSRAQSRIVFSKSCVQ